MFQLKVQEENEIIKDLEEKVNKIIQELDYLVTKEVNKIIQELDCLVKEKEKEEDSEDLVEEKEEEDHLVEERKESEDLKFIRRKFR